MRFTRLVPAILVAATALSLHLQPNAHADGSSLPLPAPKDMAGAAYAANPANPLAGGSWAINNGFWENGRGLYNDYLTSPAEVQAALGRAALQPSALWMTGNNSSRSTKFSDYLGTLNPETDPGRLVQIALFGLWPRGESKRKTPLTEAEQGSYRTWIQQASAGIGAARVVIALEPDLAITANTGSDGVRDATVRQGLAKYAAKYLHDHNPNAAVYLDAGASDWLSPKQAATLLKRSGVKWTRGFSLDITHYTRAGDNITHGAAVIKELAKSGIKGTHFVIDTADSGRGYTHAAWSKKFGADTFDNSRNCTDSAASLCNALGVPPTWKVVQPAYVSALKLTTSQVKIARRSVDAYLWLTRPWMYNQASPYQHDKALPAAQFTPFAGLF